MAGVVLFLLSGVFTNTIAQKMNASAEITGIVSSSDATPFWIVANRYGRYASSGSQIGARFQAHSSRELANFSRSDLVLDIGADIIARPGDQSTVTFNQGYVKVSGLGLELSAGRFHNTSPVHDPILGMGSLGVSGNATPVPQIRLGLTNWTDVPLTRGFAEVRAHLAHGWLEKDRFTESPFYQEKVGHIRFGGDLPVNLYGGLAHYSMWGGKNNPVFGDLPANFSDFWRVFIGIGGDERAPDVEEDYLLGDHLGAWDFGMMVDKGAVSFTLYRQMPLETKDNLKLKSLQDALNGISLRFDESLDIPLRGITYEFMYTKWQDGPRVENVLDDGTRCFDFPERCRDLFQGNENYYNHHIYRVGWATQGRTIGNPLFRINDSPISQTVWGIDNNRIVAHHLGAEFVTKSTRWRLKITASRNYGTRNDPFETPAEQLSAGLQSETRVHFMGHPVVLIADIAWDNGDLFGTQFGALAGFRISR